MQWGTSCAIVLEMIGPNPVMDEMAFSAEEGDDNRDNDKMEVGLLSL
jgi:hypothetical protein